MGRLDENQQDAVDNTPVDNQPGHHPEHEQDQPDLDEFAERFGVASDDDSGHGGALANVATAARSVIGRVREVAEPVGHAVVDRVGRVRDEVEDYRRLVERVEALEAEVAVLQKESADQH